MDVVKQIRADVDQSKRKKTEYIDSWERNINERRGKDYDTAADEGRSPVPMDWTITKAKAAQLFSQVPTVRLVEKNPAFKDAVPVFATIVNDVLKKANVGAVVSECVVDCINASGIGAAIVRYEALTEPVPVKAVDPLMEELAVQGVPGDVAPPEVPMPEIPQQNATRTTDWRIAVDRISPSDLLWKSDFRLSDWKKAPWIGQTVRDTWPVAKRVLRLTDDMKEKVIGGGLKRNENSMNNSADTKRSPNEELVEWDEIFYWRHIYHEDETYYDAIHHLVFVAGLEEPVINEPWKGQRFDKANGGYVGSCHLPIQVLTLAYISDEAIPPSDSAIIRPQVKELQESRQHMREQRKHSRPLRWFDVDRIDPSMAGDLINGTWQGMIPTIGDGTKVIGEVARTSYPRENLEFDRMLKQDIQEAVGVGPNQMNTFASGERSASEANIVDQSFQTETGMYRAKVAAFYVALSEVAAGLFALYGEVSPTGIGASIGPEGMKRLETWDRTRLNQKFVYDVRADSTVRVDAQQEMKQIVSMINITAQSPFANVKPLMTKLFELGGFDPAECVVEPQPKGPEPPKVSFSFKAEDLIDPLVQSILVHAGYMSPEEVEAAKQARLAAMAPPQGGGMIPGGGAAAPPPPPPSPTPGRAVTESAPKEQAHPDWEAGGRVITRRSEG